MNKLSFPNVTELDAELPLYLTSIGHWDYQERTRRPEGFPDYQWLQADAGAGELIVGDKRYAVKPGQGFFLFPREAHLYQPVADNWGVHWMSFNGGLVPSLLRQAGIIRSGVFALSAPERIIAHFDQIHALSLSRIPLLGMEISKLLYAFLLDLSRSVRTGASSADHRLAKLQPVVRFIEANSHRPISIDEMAGAIDVSVQYLCQLFKVGMRMRPMEYVNRERIKRSKEWMFREPGIKMREVAAKVGFDNPSYFSSVFKRIEGMSPEQFKLSHGRNS
ncbi:AraC family transcriptional regulator [Cohnella suwonensis]|uniref:AraC family transcriptional regulator n=1 Tax=Cohnella suwonensis TaxID=696072 RepID=A0ABW0LSG7_9BACL